MFIYMICLLLIILAIIFKFPTLIKLYKVYYFFSKETIINNFISIRSLGWPYKTAERNEKIALFDETYRNTKDLPLNFKFRNKTFNIKSWLSDHITTGLVVLKIDDITNAKLVYEQYYHDNIIIFSRKDNDKDNFVI